jgi:hypothetical protein
MCQQWTHAPQQTTGLFDHLVGANETWAQKPYDIEGGIRLLAGPL